MGGHQGGGAYGGGYQGGGGFQGKELDVSLDVVLDDIEILKTSIRERKVQDSPDQLLIFCSKYDAGIDLL
jgi:hypothetical protein